MHDQPQIDKSDTRSRGWSPEVVGEQQRNDSIWATMFIHNSMHTSTSGNSRTHSPGTSPLWAGNADIGFAALDAIFRRCRRVADVIMARTFGVVKFSYYYPNVCFSKFQSDDRSSGAHVYHHQPWGISAKNINLNIWTLIVQWIYSLEVWALKETDDDPNFTLKTAVEERHM
jgi:hypothetical protein